MTKLEHRGALPLRQTEQPYVEDITDIAFGARPPPQSPRVYRVVYPGVGNEAPTSVEVSCGGDQRSQTNEPGPGRQCFTPIAYLYLGALTVDYKFQQDRLPIVDAAKDPQTMREPEGVLAFDGHIRAWLDSLTKKP